MHILLASANPHKLAEISAIWAELSGSQSPPAFELVGPDAIDRTITEPVEDQDTFEGNAALKARHYAEASGMWCLADDSGLVVDALGGRPGVHSARYAGADGPRDAIDRANNRRLLEELADTPPAQRSARFVCVMVVAAPLDKPTAGPTTHAETPDRQDRIVAVVRGTVEGQILTRPQAGPDARGRGDNGFGYDPLFLLPELGKTTAELSPQEKNRISHRGQAARLMWRQLHEHV